MLQAIAILGGWLLMMGQHDRSESLFYYFRIEDQVPQNHLLRFIDRYVSFDFVREKLRASYSETGRPSMDPEVLLRILLLGYLYGITSERKLLEELRMHLAWRWFTGLGFEQEIPHHSTFSKNRHGRFQESNLFQELFERIVEQCIAAGLVEGEQMSVDGSFIMANASHHSRIPREQFTEAAQVNYGARKYLEELEQENGDGEPIHQQDKVSTTDPDSTYLTKGNRAAELGYFDNYLIDNESCVIVGVQATAARLSQESAAARDMIDRYYERYGRRPMGVAADNTYGNGELLQWLDDRGITPYIRVKEGPNSPPDLYGIEKFTYVPEENCYLCPAGKPLNYVGINKRNRAHRYYSTVKRCRGCGQKPQCTRGKFRTIAIHTCEAARQKADEVAKTPEFAVALRKRRKVEALFSELKNLIGLRRLRLRRIKFVREQFYLAAVAQNLKRLVRFLNMRAQPAMASALATTTKRKHESEETPLRENASSKRVFQHQLAISLIEPWAYCLLLGVNGGAATVIPCRRNTFIIFSRSGGPPPAALIISAASRKYAGPMIAGHMTASCFTSSLPKLSKRCTAPRAIHSACPGPTSIGVPSTVQVRTPSIP